MHFVVLFGAITSLRGEIQVETSTDSSAKVDAEAKGMDGESFDAKKVVKSLASKNSAPKLTGDEDERKPIFDERYDWGEQERIQEAIQLLVEHAAEAWPELVNHLDDKRYAITYRVLDSAYNFSIGEICEQIISDNISQAYYIHLLDDAIYNQQVYAVMSSPSVVKQGKLREWCEKRKNKKLYELQIEMCRWAITRIPELTDAPESKRQAAISAVKNQINTLETTKKPVPVKRFFRSLETHSYAKLNSKDLK